MKHLITLASRWIGKLADLIRQFFLLNLFILGMAFIFYALPQARDMLAISAEHTTGPLMLFVSAFVFAFISWYTSTLLIHARYYREHKHFDMPRRYRWYPRFMAMLALSVPGFALLDIAHADVSITAYYLALVGYFVLAILSAFLLYFKRIRVNLNATAWPVLLILTIGIMLWNGFVQTFDYPCNLRFSGILLILSSIVFLYFTSSRVLNPDEEEEVSKDWNIRPLGFIPIRIHLPRWHRPWFNALNLLSLFLLIVYICAMQSVEMARFLGPYSIPFVAFTLFLGLGNLVSFASVLFKLRIHYILFVVALVMGGINEPHWVFMQDRDEPVFAQRISAEAYADHWIQKWKSDPRSKIPMLIVLADGGASRSGLWSSAMLGAISDRYGINFDNQIFSMSGSSGGSVGISAHYAQLRHGTPYQLRSESEAFFSHDFLSFTMMRLVGPDLLMYFVGNTFSYDRARSLEIGMETSPDAVSISSEFALPFSVHETSFRQRLNSDRPLPALFLNTTRMRSGTPGVISTLDLKDGFNGRIDVLDIIDTASGSAKDLHLSTAAVLCSRFPYISPAGRIGDHYFIDGGYFDNSGAGVSQEMLAVLLDRLDVHDTDHSIRSRLVPVLIHFKNSPGQPHKEGGIHPISNDLLAPIFGISGVRSSQTSINDSRMKQFLDREFVDPQVLELNLMREGTAVKNGPFRPNDDEDFSMNWVISKLMRLRMHAEVDAQMRETVIPKLDVILMSKEAIQTN